MAEDVIQQDKAALKRAQAAARARARNARKKAQATPESIVADRERKRLWEAANPERAAEKRALRAAKQVRFIARKKAAATPEQLEQMRIKARDHSRAWEQRNPEVVLERAARNNRLRWTADRDGVLAAQRAAYQKHKEKWNAARRSKLAAKRAAAPLPKRTSWRKGMGDPAKRAETMAAWRKANPDYFAKRYWAIPHVRIQACLMAKMRKSLKAQGAAKAARFLPLLGCTLAEARAHLEAQFRPGMSWANHGEWHIDHILPCASFDLTDPDQQSRCFHYSNLQPLWAAENLAKKARTDWPGLAQAA